MGGGRGRGCIRLSQSLSLGGGERLGPRERQRRLDFGDPLQCMRSIGLQGSELTLDLLATRGRLQRLRLHRVGAARRVLSRRVRSGGIGQRRVPGGLRLGQAAAHVFGLGAQPSEAFLGLLEPSLRIAGARPHLLEGALGIHNPGQRVVPRRFDLDPGGQSGVSCRQELLDPRLELRLGGRGRNRRRTRYVALGVGIRRPTSRRCGALLGLRALLERRCRALAGGVEQLGQASRLRFCRPRGGRQLDDSSVGGIQPGRGVGQQLRTLRASGRELGFEPGDPLFERALLRLGALQRVALNVVVLRESDHASLCSVTCLSGERGAAVGLQSFCPCAGERIAKGHKLRVERLGVRVGRFADPAPGLGSSEHRRGGRRMQLEQLLQLDHPGGRLLQGRARARVILGGRLQAVPGCAQRSLRLLGANPQYGVASVTSGISTRSEGLHQLVVLTLEHLGPRAHCLQLDPRPGELVFQLLVALDVSLDDLVALSDLEPGRVRALSHFPEEVPEMGQLAIPRREQHLLLSALVLEPKTQLGDHAGTCPQLLLQRLGLLSEVADQSAHVWRGLRRGILRHWLEAHRGPLGGGALS